MTGRRWFLALSGLSPLLLASVAEAGQLPQSRGHAGRARRSRVEFLRGRVGDKDLPSSCTAVATARLDGGFAHERAKRSGAGAPSSCS